MMTFLDFWVVMTLLTSVAILCRAPLPAGGAQKFGRGIVVGFFGIPLVFFVGWHLMPVLLNHTVGCTP